MVEVTRCRDGTFDADLQKQRDEGGIPPPERRDFTYCAGSSVFLDPVSFEIDWITPTAKTVADDIELARSAESFALLHEEHCPGRPR